MEGATQGWGPGMNQEGILCLIHPWVGALSSLGVWSRGKRMRNLGSVLGKEVAAVVMLCHAWHQHLGSAQTGWGSVPPWNPGKPVLWVQDDAMVLSSSSPTRRCKPGAQLLPWLNVQQAEFGWHLAPNMTSLFSPAPSLRAALPKVDWTMTLTSLPVF